MKTLYPHQRRSTTSSLPIVDPDETHPERLPNATALNMLYERYNLRLWSRMLSVGSKRQAIRS
jgi:hypothetical protein